MSEELTDKLMDMALQAKELGVQVNVVTMYQAFYNQHKEVNGSFKKYLSAEPGLYQSKMQERFDWCLDRVQQVIACKYQYQKQRPNDYCDGLYLLIVQQNQRSVI